jgi:hypothetical protein
MLTLSLTQTLITGAAGILLSLGFSYIPGLSTWFAAKTPEIKRLIMLGLLVVVAAGGFALGCFNIFVTDVPCTQVGLTQLLVNLVIAAIANQTTYSLSPQTEKVKAAKLASQG